jgi:hypothetical protein
MICAPCNYKVIAGVAELRLSPVRALRCYVDLGGLWWFWQGWTSLIITAVFLVVTPS